MLMVMMADSVQAGVQALKSNDAAAMEQRVHDVIQEKIDKQQLQESPLTFRDLETIARSFIIVLSGMNHIRIEYQKPDELPAATAGSQAVEKAEEEQA